MQVARADKPKKVPLHSIDFGGVFEAPAERPTSRGPFLYMRIDDKKGSGKVSMITYIDIVSGSMYRSAGVNNPVTPVCGRFQEEK